MPRKLTSIKSKNFQGYGCSECNWVFNPSGLLLGEALAEMKTRYEAQREMEFAVHVCNRTHKRHKSSTAKNKKAEPFSPNIHDYPSSMSQYERESLAAEAKLKEMKKSPKRTMHLNAD
jgi:hypothetical protein